MGKQKEPKILDFKWVDLPDKEEKQETQTGTADFNWVDLPDKTTEKTKPYVGVTKPDYPSEDYQTPKGFIDYDSLGNTREERLQKSQELTKAPEGTIIRSKEVLPTTDRFFLGEIKPPFTETKEDKEKELEKYIQKQPTAKRWAMQFGKQYGELQEAKIDRATEELTALKNQLELSNKKIDLTNQADVDAYNEVVNQYNTLLEEQGVNLKELERGYNIINAVVNATQQTQQQDIAGTAGLIQGTQRGLNEPGMSGLPLSAEIYSRRQSEIQEDPEKMSEAEALEYYKTATENAPGLQIAGEKVTPQKLMSGAYKFIPSFITNYIDPAIKELFPQQYQFLKADQIRKKEGAEKYTEYGSNMIGELAGLFAFAGPIHEGYNTMGMIGKLAKTNPKVANALSSFLAGGTYSALTNAPEVSEGEMGVGGAVADAIATGLVFAAFSQVGTRDWLKVTKSGEAQLTFREGAFESFKLAPKPGQEKLFLAKRLGNWLIDTGAVTGVSDVSNKVAMAVEESERNNTPLVEELQRQFTNIDLAQLGVEFAINAMFTGGIPQRYGKPQMPLGPEQQIGKEPTRPIPPDRRGVEPPREVKPEPPKGGKDAVQEQSPTEMDVRKQTKDGEGVGGKDKLQETAGEKKEEIQDAEVTGEVKKYYRGERKGQTGEIFITDNEDVAKNFGEVSEFNPKDIPQNLYEADDKIDLGYKLDLIKNEAEENQIAYSPEFDKQIKDILQEQGYEGIKYRNGTFDSEEIHIFKQPKEETPQIESEGIIEGENRVTPEKETKLSKEEKSKPEKKMSIYLDSGESSEGFNVLGNYDKKYEAEQFASENDAVVHGYLNGKYKRGWVVVEKKSLEEQPTIDKESIPSKESKPKKVSAKDEFKVGDVLDTQGNTNMVDPVTVREVSGNTLKLTDAEGTEFSGMQRSVVRNLIKEGSWKKVSQQPSVEGDKEPSQTGEAVPVTEGKKKPKKGRALFTEDELKRFDAKGIDVSQVPEKYKAEALQQLEFQEKPTMTNEEVRAEYKRIEQNRKEEEKNPLALADNNKSTAMRLFAEGKKDKDVLTAIGDNSKAMMDKVREWRKEYEKGEKSESILDTKFQHHAWYKGAKKTKREALDEMAKTGDFTLDKKPSKKQSENLLDPMIYDDILRYTGKEGGTYKLSPEEKQYFLERRQYHQEQKRSAREEALQKPIDAKKEFDRELKGSSLFSIDRANRELKYAQKANDKERIDYWETSKRIATANTKIAKELFDAEKENIKTQQDFENFKNQLDAKIEEHHQTPIKDLATGDIKHLITKEKPSPREQAGKPSEKDYSKVKTDRRTILSETIELFNKPKTRTSSNLGKIDDNVKRALEFVVDNFEYMRVPAKRMSPDPELKDDDFLLDRDSDILDAIEKKRGKKYFEKYLEDFDYYWGKFAEAGFIEDEAYNETGDRFKVTEAGKKFFDQFNRRADTRATIKKGEDLFPEYAGIPIEELLEKPEFQEEINEEENSRIKSIEEQTEAITSKTESLESDESRSEQLQEIDNAIEQIDNELKNNGIVRDPLVIKYAEKLLDSAWKEQLEFIKTQGKKFSKEELEKAHQKLRVEYLDYYDKVKGYIDNKNMEKLNSILHTGNKTSRKFFEEYTNTKLGKTNKELKQKLDQWAKEPPKEKPVAVTPEKKPKPSEVEEGRPFKGTIYDKNLEQLKKILPIDELSGGDHFRLVSKPYMPLTVEVVMNSDVQMKLYLSHNYMQNGDLMDDPFMSIVIDKVNHTVEALEFQQSSTGTYGVVYPEKGKVNLTEKKGQNDFLKTWLKNLEEQGFGKSQRYDTNDVPLAETYDAEYWDKFEGKDKVTEKPKEELEKSPDAQLVDALLKNINAGGIKNNPELTEIADRIYGGTRAQGKYQTQDAYNALEAAVNKWITENKIYDLPTDEALTKLRDLLKKLPTQTSRSAEKDLLQQFSTPPTLSYFAAKLLNPNSKDIILEPSAGTGSLISFIREKVAKVFANEIDPKRRELLEYLGYETSGVDAEFINSLLPQNITPTKIIMNPPFSATGGRVKKNKNLFGYKHLQDALARLQDGGRLVAILGEGAEFGRPEADKLFWNKVVEKYNVRADVGIANNDYGKYGTSFGNRVIVIDKTGPTPDRRPELQGNYETIEEALNAAERIISSAPETLGVDKEDVLLGERPQEGGTVGTSTRSGGSGRVGGRGGVPGTTGKGKTPKGDIDVEGEIQPGGTEQPIRPTESEVGGQRKPSTGGTGEGKPSSSDSDKSTGNITYEKSEVKEKKTESSGFVEYKPSQKPADSVEHPANLVETASMAAVDIPKITYKPNLPEEVTKKSKLKDENINISDAQLETIGLIGQRHNLIFENGTRAGFFVGDGTGVGKGRIVAGTIFDNWRQGRKKALWVSYSPDLLKDARRDLDGVGAKEIPASIINQYVLGEPIPKDYNGVIFTTYSSLISEKGTKSRLKDITDWLDDDGVIIFDEAHKAKNLFVVGRGSEPTKTATTVVKLQDELKPKARVVYASATGATDVRHMGYMTRLGIWGKRTPFPSFHDFMVEIGTGGIGAMEMVARDLKALGIYSSRTISYEGIEYVQTEHELTPDQRRIYNTAAEGWQVAMQDIEAAIEVTDSKKSQRFINMKFWGAHQRFFKQVLTALKVPTLLTNTDKYLAEGKSVVIQMIGTQESSTKRKVNELLSEGGDLDDLDLSPREILAQMIENAFPTTQYERYTDENGNEKTRPLLDAKGNPVQNPEAVKMKEKLLNKIGDINLPENPLDQIVNYYELRAKNEGDSTLRVAELSGRKKRLTKNIVRNPDPNAKDKWIFGDKITYQKRVPKDISQKDANTYETKQFQGGRKRVSVITGAASTGITLSSDKTARNKQQRVHILFEPPWAADVAMQFFGRTHRSNQEVPPVYDLLTTDAGGEKRFASTIAKRLASLGALTKGERGSAGGGQYAKYNFENEYGEAALNNIYNLLERDAEIKGIENNREVLKKMGVLKGEPPFESVQDDDKTNVTLFLNRILGLEVDIQNALFNRYNEEFGRVIEAAKESGGYDEGVTDLEAESIKIAKEPETVHTDELTGATTQHYQLDTVVKTHPVDFNEAKSRKEIEDGRAFYKQTNSGNVVLKLGENTRTDPKTGRLSVSIPLLNPTGNRSYVSREDFNEKYEKLEPYEAEPIWKAKYELVPKTKTEEVHILSGAILPLWKNLKIKGHSHIKVIRAVTDNKQRIVGVKLPNDQVGEILRSLNIKRDLREPEEIFTAVLEQGEVVKLMGELELKKVRVSGEDRIELVGTGSFGIDSERIEDFKEKGLIFERIQFKPRLFIPTDKYEGPFTLSRLLRDYPPLAEGEESLSAKPKLSEGWNHPEYFTTMQEALNDNPYLRNYQHTRVPLTYRYETFEGWMKIGYNPIARNFYKVKKGETGYVEGKEIYRAIEAGRLVPTVSGGRIEVPDQEGVDSFAHETAHAIEIEIGKRDRGLQQDIQRWKKGVAELAKKYADDVPEEKELFVEAYLAHLGWNPEIKDVYKLPASILERANKIAAASSSGKDNLPAMMAKNYPRKPQSYKVKSLTPGKNFTFSGGRLEILSAQPAHAPPFYSKMQRVLTDKLPAKFHAKMLQDILRSGEIKENEIKWSGIDDFVAEKRGTGEKIDKQELLDFLRANELKIEEVTKNQKAERGYTQVWYDSRENLQIAGFDIEVDDSGELFIHTPDDIEIRNLEDAHNFAKADWGKAVKDNLYDLETLFNEQARIKEPDTKFSRYTLPGGDNYRELLFTLPPKEIYSKGKLRVEEIKDARGNTNYAVVDENGKQIGVYRKKEFAESIIEDIGDQPYPLSEYEQTESFKSSHWDEPNVMAHTRVNDRTLPDGKRILFIEEIQSDWALGARKHGIKIGKITELPEGYTLEPVTYRYENISPQNRQRLQNQRGLSYQRILDDNYVDVYAVTKRGEKFLQTVTKEQADSYAKYKHYVVVDRDGDFSDFQLSADKSLAKEYFLDNYNRTRGDKGVPDMPFKNNWHEFVLKNLLRKAAEQGYSGIGWTTGEQQAERYDLKKYVKSVLLTKDGDLHIVKKGEDRYELLKRDVPEDKLEEYIGKEPAKELLNQKPNPNGDRFIHTKDLSFGGEWAKNLYDKVIPNFLNKYGKKWSAKVGVADLITKQSKYYHDNTYTETIGDELVLKSTRDGKELARIPYEINYQQDIQQKLLDIANKNDKSGKRDLVHFLPITEQMKDAVLFEGQPLFSIKSGQKETEARREQGQEPTPEEMLDGNVVDFGVGLGQVVTGLADQFKKVADNIEAKMHEAKFREKWGISEGDYNKLKALYREILTAPQWFFDKEPQLRGIWDIIDRHLIRDVNEDLAIIREDKLQSNKPYRKLSDDAKQQFSDVTKEYEDKQYDLTKVGEEPELETFEQIADKVRDQKLKDWILNVMKPTVETGMDYIKDLDRWMIVNENLSRNPFLEDYYAVKKSDKPFFLEQAKDRFFNAGPNNEDAFDNELNRLQRAGVTKNLEVTALNNIWANDENIRYQSADFLVDEKYSKYDGKFYLPTSRLGYKYYITAIRKPDPQEALLFGTPTERFFTTDNDTRRLETVARDLEQQGYEVKVGEFAKNQEEILTNNVTQEDILDLAILSGVDADNKVIDRLIKSVISKGFTKHFIPKRYIPGFNYTPENIERSLYNWTGSVAYFKNRTIGNRSLDKKLAELKENKVLRPGTANDKYIQGLRTRLDTRDEGFSRTLRAIASLWYLSLRPSYLAQQIVQPMNTLMPYLPVVAKELGLRQIEAEKAFGKAFIDTHRYYTWKILDKLARLRGKTFDNNLGLEPEFLSMQSSLERQGVGRPLRTMEIVGETVDPQRYYNEGRITKASVGLAKIVNLPGILVEDLTRAQGIRAFWLMGKKAGLRGQKLEDFIARSVAKSYGPASGRLSKPPFYNLPGQAKIAKVARGVMDSHITFKNFAFMNYGQWGKNWRALKDDRLLRPLMYKLAAQVGLGGLKYMMWVSSILTLLSGIYAMLNIPEDPEEQYRDMFMQLNKLVPGLGDVLYRGLASITFKVDLSALFSQQAPLATEEYGFDRDLGRAIGGAGLGALSGAVQGIIEGRPKEIVPSGIRNLMTAGDYEEKGVTWGAKKLIPPEEVAPADKTKKQLGFTPLEISKAYEEERTRSFKSSQLTGQIRGEVDDIIPLIKAGRNREARKAFDELYRKYQDRTDIYTDKQEEKIKDTRSFINQVVIGRISEPEKTLVREWRNKNFYEGRGGSSRGGGNRGGGSRN